MLREFKNWKGDTPPRYFGQTLGPLPFFFLGVIFFSSRSATLI
jgi:hypothetical protein